MSMFAKMYGYFDNPDQTMPTFDPGLTVRCPVCAVQLSGDIATISLMLDGDRRSYFYRTHVACYEQATANEIEAIESALIDAIANTRNVN